MTRPPLPNGPILGGSDPATQERSWEQIGDAAAILLRLLDDVDLIHGRDYRSASDLGEAARWREVLCGDLVALANTAALFARRWRERAVPQ